MIALSNLAFPVAEAPRLLAELAAEGLAGIEVAPTRLAPWDALTPALLASHRAEVEAFGLVIPSLQAILFQAEGVALLGDAVAFGKLLDHLRRVACIGAALGARVAVFGSPRQRSRGALPAREAFALGAERFRRAAELCMAEGGLALGLEPVPATYGGDFLETAEEVLAMVRAVDHPGLRVHLDTSCVMLGGGNIGAAIRAAAPWLAHFHAAEPQLGPFAVPVADHAGAALALAEIGYRGWVSIEMRELPDWSAAVPAAFHRVQASYGARQDCG